MEDNIITIKFADSKIPEFKETRGTDYIKFDTDDKYPLYLIYLLNKSAKHNSIVGSKTTYIYGGGMKVDTPAGATEIPDQNADGFIERYNGLVKKKILDIEAFGMTYIQCIPTRGGTGWGFYHVSYEKMRANKDATIFYFKQDWTDRREEKIPFPAFDPALRINSIFMFKEYRPGNGVYGLPGFVAACNFIEADIEVGKHTLTNAQSGFSASKFINFYNGEPNEATKRSIEARFTDRFTGSQGKKLIIGFNTDPTKKPTVDDLGTSDMTKEDFTQVDNLISTNLYAGHQVTNSALFGIPTLMKGLGSNPGNELKMAYDMFKNTYVAAKKTQVELIINFLATVSGLTCKMSLIDVEPVGYEFTEATILQVAPRSWLLEKLGIDTTKYTDAPTIAPKAGAAAPITPPTTVAPSAQDAAVNENLKNLTAKQMQHVNRIIRQHSKGTLDERAALLMLVNGFGLTDDQAKTMLGLDAADQFSSDDEVALLFESHGEPRATYSAYEKRAANFSIEKPAEFKEYNDVEDKINVIRKANPKATPSAIAKELNIDEAVVTDYINSGGGIADVVKKLPKFEVRYSYEKRADVEGDDVLPTTRPFCRKMIELNRFYSRQDIQKISQFLGYDVMKRAGGFWNNDGTTEYHCRHEFFSQIVIKKA